MVAAEPGGRLVAKGAGKATVTAAFGEIQAQVPVEVVDVSTIELAAPALSLRMADKTMLVSWELANPMPNP